MATGVPKTNWNDHELSHFTEATLEDGLDVHLTYQGKQPKSEILATQPPKLKLLWPSPCNTNEKEQQNSFYYGDNLSILSSIYHSSLRGKVKLIYIDPPFATNSVFQSRSQTDAYTDLLTGAHYIEFLRKRFIFLRELLADDGSIYVHLDDNMAFHIKVIMDEVFGKRNFRNWITRKKCNPKNYTRKSYGNISLTSGPFYFLFQFTN